MRFTFAITITGIIITTSVFAASFDCTKATTLVEKAICSESQLSDLDDLMVQSYKKAMANSKSTATLKADQKNWRNNIRDKCQDSVCLKRVYSERLTVLTNIAASNPSAPSPLLTIKPTEQKNSGAQAITYGDEYITLIKIDETTYFVRVNVFHRNPRNCVDPDVVGIVTKNPTKKEFYTGRLHYEDVFFPDLKDKNEEIIVIIKFIDNKIDFKTNSDDGKDYCIANGIYLKDKSKTSFRSQIDSFHNRQG